MISFTFDYLAMNDVMKVIKGVDLKILNQEFDNDCRMTVSIRSDNAPMLVSRLADIDDVRIDE